MKTDVFKITVIILLLAGSISSCSKKESPEPWCDVNNPLTDLPWLKEFVHSSEQMPGMFKDISQCTYNNGIEGFLITPCVNCFSYVIVLYSCDGTVLQETGEGTSTEAFFEEWNIKDMKIIWKNY
jgi:hypothetical protein